MEQVSLDSDSE